MSKVSRMEAFVEITKAMDNNNIEKANEMFQIVAESIATDKKNDTFSEYIELKNKRQEMLFKNILITCEKKEEKPL